MRWITFFSLVLTEFGAFVLQQFMNGNKLSEAGEAGIFIIPIKIIKDYNLPNSEIQGNA